jgi:hypothetical protein
VEGLKERDGGLIMSALGTEGALPSSSFLLRFSNTPKSKSTPSNIARFQASRIEQFLVTGVSLW